jgi:hypothetical protein
MAISAPISHLKEVKVLNYFAKIKTTVLITGSTVLLK